MDTPPMGRRVALRRAGGPEVLHVQAVEIPRPEADELVIVMEAAGVAFGDVTIRQGRNPGRLPPVLGYDVVGHVHQVGSAVTTFAVGDRVAALPMTGGYATHVVTKADRVVAVPPGLDAAEVDALVLNYLTAWQLLHRRAKVSPGQSILILGAAGGVGSALTELAGLSDLNVFGTASPARRPVLAARGVTVVDDADSLPQRVDAVFDPVGGPSLARSRRAAVPKGVVVSYGFSFSVDAGHSRTAGLIRTGLAIVRAKLTPGARLVPSFANKPEEVREDLTHLIDLLSGGQVHPEVERLPLADASEAHRRLEARQVVGKLVLVP